MMLQDVLCRECVAVDDSLRTKADALAAVARLATQAPQLADVPEKKLLKALTAREKVGSTGFGGGIAIPHCRLASVDDFVVGVVAVPGGVDFDALDGEPVRVIAFIIAPEGQPDAHIRLLSGVSEVLHESRAVADIAGASTAEDIVSVFLRGSAEHAPAAPAEDQQKSLVYVAVEEDEIFHEILQKLVSIDDSSSFVVAGESTAAYLRKMPLFAGFWSDASEASCRLIMTVVDSRLTNEAIRRVTSVTGPLDKASGVLVLVQPLAFVGGSLFA
jgi:mannitol/fructose-specific phosphotransferase system IIA component (Ntr-type)